MFCVVLKKEFFVQLLQINSPSYSTLLLPLIKRRIHAFKRSSRFESGKGHRENSTAKRKRIINLKTLIQT